jgi:hypothetical protein
MTDLIMSLVPVVFASNLVMSGVKYLSIVKNTNAWLRGTLLVVSILGIVAEGAVTGHPVDLNQVNSLLALLGQGVGAAIVAHFSFKAISA